MGKRYTKKEGIKTVIGMRNRIINFEKTIMEFTNDYYYGFNDLSERGLTMEAKQQILDYDIGASIDKND